MTSAAGQVECHVAIAVLDLDCISALVYQESYHPSGRKRGRGGRDRGTEGEGEREREDRDSIYEP